MIPAHELYARYRPCLILAHADQQYAAAAARSFRREGWDVYTALTGPEARRLARMLRPSLIVLGTGLLKPNVSTMVGGLYSQEDERRDAGFSLFYMGINVGAFFGPIVCGFLAQRIDWHLGFGATGVGMTLVLIQYVAGRRRLDRADTKPSGGRKATASLPRRPFTSEEKKRIAVIGILFLFSVLFWTAFEQAPLRV